MACPALRIAPLLRGTTALALAAAAAVASAQGDLSAARPPEPQLVLTSYGEINYTRPSADPSAATADLRRFVLGVQRRFDDKTTFVGEIEFEHSVTSADDPGEVEIEQAYVERRFGEVVSGRAGLMLIPVGLLNESHEPTAYYGVERNFVETAIIPTTWREGGLQVVGALPVGLTLQAGLTTSFDLNRWDATSTEGRQSPLGSVHQELAVARAHDGAGFLAANYRGVPGLHLGAFLFVGRASQGQPNTPRATVSLWDVHARWTPWRLDLAALYARGNISNTAALNRPHVGEPTLIPQEFDGWYAQAAIRAWSGGDIALSPFVRHERFNTGRRYADLGAGLTPPPLETETASTVGVNFQPTSGLVLKADFQRLKLSSNRVDVGLGWSF